MAPVDLSQLPRPSVSFASDNCAGAHPEVLEAIARANVGHARPYGYDSYSEAATARFCELFGREVEVLLVWGGTGANVVGLSTMLRASDAVVCASGSHINVDEGGGPERFLGAKLLDLPTSDGKLRPDDLDAVFWMRGDEHHVQPAVLSITQSTELGTLYQPGELRDLVESAHRRGLKVHVDGARIANAVAALGVELSTITTEVGIDVLSFGGTKNGMLYGEAVVIFDPELARRAKFLRKQAMQLPSKSRFVAAQFTALLADDLWLRSASHANAMAALLYEQTRTIPGVRYVHGPEVNAVFPFLPPGAIAELSAWCPFYPWDIALDQARWMAAWDTSAEDVSRFAAGVRAALS